MKVSFNNGVSSYSGKYGEVVYSSWYNNRLCIGRQYVYPSLGEPHQLMSEISKHLNDLYKEADPLYIQDLKTYAEKNARQNLPKSSKHLRQMPSSKSIFIKIMWAWYDSDPMHIDLKTISLADIISLESPARSVSKAVDAGYLKTVTNYTQLDNLILQG